MNRADSRPGQRVTFLLWDSPRAPRLQGTVIDVIYDQIEVKPDTPISSRTCLGVHRSLIVGAQSP